MRSVRINKTREGHR